MKICSLYGVGYYYIPGTDTCIKIGGYVRFEAYHNEAGGLYAEGTAAGCVHPAHGDPCHAGPLPSDRRRAHPDRIRHAPLVFRLRRQRPQQRRAAPSKPAGPTLAIALERAFIQFAGFTIGRSDTFFAFYNGAAYGLVPFGFDGSSGPSGLNVAAYTWQFGNGLSATVSLEDQIAHSAGIVDLGNAAAAANTAGVMGSDLFAGNAGGDQQGQWVPDIVGNLRVDQAWGSAQIMGGLHAVGCSLQLQQTNSATLRRQRCDQQQLGQLRSPGRQVGLGGRCRHDPEDALGCQGHDLRSDRVC